MFVFVFVHVCACVCACIHVCGSLSSNCVNQSTEEMKQMIELHACFYIFTNLNQPSIFI